MDPKDFFSKAIEAVKRLGRRAILITGSPPTDRSDAEENVKEFQYLPYSRVFHHASVIVHPGGIGTLSQALGSGRPMLITPVAFDQPDNAHRVSRLGVARVVPFRKVTATNLKEQIRAIFNDRNYHDRAANVGRQVRSEDGVQRACDLIEKIPPDF
jgi:UDP:flavonoid glycosyltransferase YjiC (YdhE family)